MGGGGWGVRDGGWGWEGKERVESIGFEISQRKVPIHVLET